MQVLGCAEQELYGRTTIRRRRIDGVLECGWKHGRGGAEGRAGNVFLYLGTRGRCI